MLRLLGALPRLRDLPAQRLRWRLLHWLLATAVFFVLIGILLLAGALYLFVAQTLSIWQALAITGIVTVVVAVVAIGQLNKAVRAPQKAPGNATDALDEMIVGRLNEALPGISKHGGELVLLGLAAGVLLGALSDRGKPR